LIAVNASGRAMKSEIWRSRIAKIVAFVAPLLIAAVAVLLVQQVRTANTLLAAERSAQEQRTLLQVVLSAHQDIETGARGYVITGNPAFLEPYHEGLARLREIRPQIAQRDSGDTRGRALRQQLLLDSLEKVQNAQVLVALRHSGDKSAAEARVNAGTGKRAMDRIRAQVAALIAFQNGELKALRSSTETAISRQRLSMFALLATLTLLLLAAWLALQNLLHLRERSLASLEDHFLRRQAILESVTDGIITLNPSGSIESVNPATLRMFGYAHGELARRDAGILFASQPPTGAVAEHLRALELDGDGAGAAREIAARRSDGVEFPTEVAISAMRLNEGLRYVAVIRDVTERKKVEQLKSEFVSTVSHELRTPLTSIAGALGLLHGGAAGVLDARAERLITIAHNNAERLVRLINDILDIEKIESGKMPFKNRRIDLKAAVAVSIAENRSYAAKFNATIAFFAPMTPMTVDADPDRLAQILTNLLSNAAKYSPDGGTVEVSIAAIGKSYRITVADEGPGIPEEFRARIFGKFAQADSSDSREKGGTGLGLSIVNEIAQRLGGEVSFESEPGKGARFHVDLPAASDASPDLPLSPGERHLLVCGNGAGTTFGDALRQSGYWVTFVKEQAELRGALSSKRFDGIVVDMGLRDGAGIAAIRTVREVALNADTPLLALGGRSGATELDGDAALVVDWLRKPVDVNRLVGSIGNAADRIAATGKPRILHVEDDPDVVRLVAEALDGRADVVSADGVAAARRALERLHFDLAIIDLGLADGNGIEILPDLRQAEGKPPIPVLIFSAQDADPEMANRVDAYLTKARTPIGSLVGLVEGLTAGVGEGADAA